MPQWLPCDRLFMWCVQVLVLNHRVKRRGAFRTGMMYEVQGGITTGKAGFPLPREFPNCPPTQKFIIFHQSSGGGEAIHPLILFHLVAHQALPPPLAPSRPHHPPLLDRRDPKPRVFERSRFCIWACGQTFVFPWTHGTPYWTWGRSELCHTYS